MPYYEAGGITIYRGDCREIMVALAPSSADTIITDPPYGLSFMGAEWDHGVPGVEFWRAALRVAKPGAMLLAFGGTRTYHRLTCAIEDAGWEIRDSICWLYGQGFPKSLDISKAIDRAAGVEPIDLGASPTWRESKRDREKDGRMEVRGENAGRLTAPATDAAKLWDGWGTALKPAWEPIILAMKPLDGTFAENAQKHGVAGLNIDGARIKGPKGDGVWGTSNKTTNPNRVFNASPDKANYRSERNAAGRWPANVALDEEAAAMLDEQTGTLVSGRLGLGHTDSGKDAGVFGAYGGRAINREFGNDSGGASRFFYCAKAGSAERSHGSHPTQKPLDLMKWLCLLTKTPTGGIVVDPFMGSGTTLLAARESGRECIGIEIEERYCEIAAKRLSQGVLL
jgi:site-specific DNA-methyltransferase (adenine-specific)